jgi:hypothetical protein
VKTRDEVATGMVVAGLALALVACGSPAPPTPPNPTAPPVAPISVPRPTTAAAAEDGPIAAPGRTFPGTPCGGDSPTRESATAEELAIGTAINSDMAYLSTPYRNTRWIALDNNGTVAHVLVCLQMRKSAAAQWQE